MHELTITAESRFSEDLDARGMVATIDSIVATDLSLDERRNTQP